MLRVANLCLLMLLAGVASAQTPAEYFTRNRLLGIWSANCGEPATLLNQHFTYMIDGANVISQASASARPGQAGGYLLITEATPVEGNSLALTLQIILLRPDGQPSTNSTTVNQTWRRLSANRMRLWRAVIQPGGVIPLAHPRVDVDNGLNQDDQSPSLTLEKCS
jgi:hypothetical protein